MGRDVPLSNEEVYGAMPTPQKSFFFNFSVEKMRILVHPWALLSTKLLLLCNMLVFQLSKRKNIFPMNIQHTKKC